MYRCHSQTPQNVITVTSLWRIKMPCNVKVCIGEMGSEGDGYSLPKSVYAWFISPYGKSKSNTKDNVVCFVLK